MRRLCISLFVLALVFVPVRAQDTERTPEQIDADEVIATLEDLWEAVEFGDINRYAGYLHPDYTGFGENDVYLAEGKDLAVRSMREYLKRAERIHTEMHQPRVTVRGNTAWIAYYWTDSGTLDGKPFSSRGKSTRIFVREAGGPWLCIHGHFTAVP